ncbi:Do family serine endopeptidase [Croceicoccus sp. F390]|uniref:Probable periplasmic serine endoprotease DegP-like n=1 Tax=Croceicoccus esteveae TaxID=3075597 RepID=A0ABU2ZJK8_9SPHN|nr:Do family serine endopeptidase [Croceicoccus sp. F390]MDT0576790.1 Do family serine endopeptidase [Croceicoccus sp. F390]
MRYVYTVTSALLLGGAAVTLATGYPAGAQIAQNDDAAISRVVPRSGAPASFADLTDQLAPAVVNISTRQRVEVQNNPFAGTPFEGMFGNRGGGQPQTREAQSLGSGFIISGDGYVVTNNHVVTAQGPATIEEITVTLPDGMEYEAKLVGNDAESDLAVLKISRPQAFPFVNFGNSRDARVGDWVIAIGNPFGLGGTVTSGIISSVYRATGGGGAYDRYLQTDAAINRGNSGGPMFDMQGNVIGINNAIFSPTGGSVGIGFAIPAETAAPIVQQLIRGEAIERGYLGIQIQPVSDDLAASLGIARKRGEFVQSVVPGGAAAQAGLRAGDVVLEINGQTITPDQTLSFIVANTNPGTRVPVKIIRDGKQLSLQATVAQRPTQEELAEQNSFAAPQGDEEESMGSAQPSDEESVIGTALGISVTPLTPQIARQLGVSETAGGLVIAGVSQSSDAAAKGLRRGDIILSANYRTVSSNAELEAVIRSARSENRAAVLVRVQRRGQPAIYIPLRLR